MPDLMNNTNFNIHQKALILTYQTMTNSIWLGCMENDDEQVFLQKGLAENPENIITKFFEEIESEIKETVQILLSDKISGILGG